jgi:transposase-like protein
MVRTESVNQTYVRKYEKLYRTKPASLVDVVHRFGSEEVCRDYLEKLRWPNGAICPRCNSASVSEISTRHQFDCNACRYRFSVTSGTIFDNSKLPLWKWMAAVYLMLESKKSMSANQIKRTLGTTYKTAWYLCHRIREAMETAYEGPVLFGIVEVDETLLKPRNKRWPEKGREHGGYPANVPRVWVVGAIQRGGEVRLGYVPNVKRPTLHAFIKKHVKDETEAIYTDALRSYLGIADHDTRHQFVNHEHNQWVVGDVHTNSIESVWNLFERALMGAYHKISVKHLDAYLQELEFRFNNRKNQFMFRDLLKRILSKAAVRYELLVA